MKKLFPKIAILIALVITSVFCFTGCNFLEDTANLINAQEKIAELEQLLEEKEQELTIEQEKIAEIPTQIITKGTFTYSKVKISVPEGEENDCISIQGDQESIVIINSGNFNGGQTPFGGAGNTTIWCNNPNGKIIINDGVFTINGLATNEEGILDIGHIDLIYCSQGEIEINGGWFEGQDDSVWLVNCKDQPYTDGIAKVTIKGGIFVNWNPADNCSEGENTSFVPEGYEVIAMEQESGDIWYKIQKHNHNFSKIAYDETHHWYICDVNNCNMVDESVTPTEHIWDEGNITKEATPTENGEKTFTCVSCGATKIEIIETSSTTAPEV